MDFAAWEGGAVEPLMPIVETRTAAHIAAIVSERIRRGVSQPKWWFWSHVLKPVAAEAAVIAHPTHMWRRIGPTGAPLLRYVLPGAGAARVRGPRTRHGRREPP
jgi:hypothetical protein